MKSNLLFYITIISSLLITFNSDSAARRRDDEATDGSQERSVRRRTNANEPKEKEVKQHTDNEIKRGSGTKLDKLDLNKSLYLLITNNQVSEAKDIIETGANINCTYWHGETPLMIAVRNKNKKMVTMLLKNPKILNLKNDSGKNAYHIAIELNLPDIAKLIKNRFTPKAEVKPKKDEKSQDKKNLELWRCINNLNVVRLADEIQKGADLNVVFESGKTIFEELIRLSNLKISLHMQKVNKDHLIAEANFKTEQILFYLINSSNVDLNGLIPAACMAIENGNSILAGYLVSEIVKRKDKININKLIPDYETLLICAIDYSNDFQLIKYIIDNSNIHIINQNGYTALGIALEILRDEIYKSQREVYAVNKILYDIIKYLLEKGATVPTHDKDYLPYDLSSLKSYLEAEGIFLERKAAVASKEALKHGIEDKNEESKESRNSAPQTVVGNSSAISKVSESIMSPAGPLVELKLSRLPTVDPIEQKEYNDDQKYGAHQYTPLPSGRAEETKPQATISLPSDLSVAKQQEISKQQEKKEDKSVVSDPEYKPEEDQNLIALYKMLNDFDNEANAKALQEIENARIAREQAQKKESEKQELKESELPVIKMVDLSELKVEAKKNEEKRESAKKELQDDRDVKEQPKKSEIQESRDFASDEKRAPKLQGNSAQPNLHQGLEIVGVAKDARIPSKDNLYFDTDPGDAKMTDPNDLDIGALIIGIGDTDPNDQIMAPEPEAV